MYRFTLQIDDQYTYKDIQHFAEMLSLEAISYSAVIDEERQIWILRWLLDTPLEPSVFIERANHLQDLSPIPAAMKPENCTLDEIEAEQDWLAHSYQQHPPFSVGPFFIFGGHYDGDVPDGQMGIQMEAVHAFGSGEHGTTKGCLEAMLDLKGQGVCPWNVLDMGTGSGILSIASWRLWKTQILGVDIEDASIDTAARYLTLNDIPQGAGKVSLLRSDGFSDGTVQAKGPYELIIANILAAPLKAIADDIVNAMDMNSYLILSGLLDEQKDEMIDVYQSATADRGFTLKRSYSLDGWSTLLLHRA